MKIYTKKGDHGETGLIGSRVKKHHARIHIVGSLDEVMVLLGQLISQVAKDGRFDETDLLRIYRNFFKIQTMTVDVDNQYKLTIEPEEERFLELAIDEMTEALPELHNFIYYTGHDQASLAQLIRTKIRGVERLIVELNETDGVDKTILSYVNRASDYFYTLGRFINLLYNEEERIMKL